MIIEDFIEFRNKNFIEFRQKHKQSSFLRKFKGLLLNLYTNKKILNNTV